MVKESDLRDWLCEHLEEVESGLVLVGKEFHIKGDGSASGFIDILAKDRYGLHVVIELKRSESTAREAAHEMIKYTHLLRQEYGMGNEDVRCILASTEWRELSTVAADFRSLSSYRVDYVIVETDKDRGIRLKPYLPPSGANRLSFFRYQMGLLSFTPEKREILFQKLTEALPQVGVTSAAVLWLDYVGPLGEITYPYALYLAIAEVSDEARKQMVACVCNEMDVSVDEVETFTFENYVYSQVIEHTTQYSDGLRVSDPDIYWGIRETWDIVSVSRLGKLEATDKLITDSEMEGFITGKRSDARIRYAALSSPTLKASWHDIVERVERCVEGISPWDRITSAVIQEIEKSYPTVDVDFHVYCPCDALMGLYQLLGRQTERYMPELRISFKADDGAHAIIGTWVWDGVTFPTDPTETVFRAFGDDICSYAILRGDPEAEMDLLKGLGLRYAVAEWVIADGGSGSWLEYRDGTLNRIPVGTEQFVQFNVFIERNQAYFRSLIRYFDENTWGL